MAKYESAQPLWKRNAAGILDFLLVFMIGGYFLAKLPGNQPPPPPMIGPAGTTTTQVFGIGGWPMLVLIVVIIAYFVLLGRTGGTVFQRAFGMKRAR
jgi:hypothetical protein